MVVKALKTLYDQEHRVIIPDFGAVIFDDISDEPHFNTLLNFNDGKLVQEICGQNGVDEAVAREEIQKFIQKLEESFDQYEAYRITGIGYFQRDDEGNIYLNAKKEDYIYHIKEHQVQKEGVVETAPSAEEKFEFDTEVRKEEEKTSEDQESEVFPSFSTAEEGSETGGASQEVHEEIPTFSSDYAEEPDDEEDKLPEEEEELAMEEFEEERTGKSRWGVWVVVIMFFLLIPAVIYFVFLSTEESERIASKDEPKASDLEVTTTSNTSNKSDGEAVEPAQKPDTKEEKVPVPDKAQIPEASPIPSEVTPAPSYNNAGGYSVIVGSFKVENNADNYVNFLIKKGYEVSKFSSGGPFHFVGFNNVGGKDEALRLLYQVRDEYEPEAWLASW